eukprot:4951593-Amphidinium_carterae.1
MSVYPAEPSMSFHQCECMQGQLPKGQVRRIFCTEPGQQALCDLGRDPATAVFFNVTFGLSLTARARVPGFKE